MSIFKRQLPTKRKNARGNNELRPVTGSIQYDSDQLHSFSESAEDYKMGTNGLRDNPVQTPRKAVAHSDFQESTLVDDSDTKIKVTPAMKQLHKMLGNHVETAIDGKLTTQQTRALRQVFNSQQNQNAAEELQRLRNIDGAPTASQRVKRMKLETKMATLRTDITRICRSA